MKVYLHSFDLYRFNVGKSDQITFFRKRPDCDDEACKIIRLELHIRDMENKKRGTTKQSPAKKRGLVRDRKAK
jgi:hypothetical protein